MSKKIEIKINSKGEVNIDMEGFKGTSCTEAMKRYIQEDLIAGGNVKEKEEYYQTEDQQVENSEYNINW